MYCNYVVVVRGKWYVYVSTRDDLILSSIYVRRESDNFLMFRKSLEIFGDAVAFFIFEFDV